MSFLYIYSTSSQLKTLLIDHLNKHRYTDSGFDIPMIQRLVDGSHSQVKFDLGIHVAATDYSLNPQPCLLMPRSSIYKTPYRICNSIGLLDAGYRGEVKVMTDVVTPNDTSVHLETGSRLFQICSHDFMPWKKVIIVDSLFDLPLPADDRGSGGFGSTGK